MVVCSHLRQIQAEESTYHEHHVGSLMQCLQALLLQHFALLSRGDHCRHEGYHRLQIPGKPLNNLSELGVRCIPLQYTRLGAAISILLNIPTCSARASLAAPLVGPSRLFWLTAGGYRSPQSASSCHDDLKAPQQRYQLAAVEGLETLQEREPEKGLTIWTTPSRTCEVEDE